MEAVYMSRLYNIWSCMKQRCYNPNNTKYHLYGGNGITICPSWRDSFEAFERWAMKNGYRDDLTIDRLDGSGGYYPGNCRWATIKQQANNKSNNRLVEYHGVLYTTSEIADRFKVPRRIITHRLYLGWDIERAIKTPIRKRGKSK